MKYSKQVTWSAYANYEITKAKAGNTKSEIHSIKIAYHSSFPKVRDILFLLDYLSLGAWCARDCCVLPLLTNKELCCGAH